MGYRTTPWVHWFSHKLMVPAGSLQFPMYSPDSPKYMDYGALGSHVAGNMFKDIDEYGKGLICVKCQTRKFGIYISSNTKNLAKNLLA